MKAQPRPEGMYRSHEVAQMLGVPYTHLDWTREKAGIQPVTVARVRYYTPEQIELMRRMMQEGRPPEGWVDTITIAREADVRPDYISGRAKKGLLPARYCLNRWWYPPEVVEMVKALREDSLRHIRRGEQAALVVDHPLDMPTVEEWEKHGFRVVRGKRTGCRHPLVEAGMGEYYARLCARCGVVYVREGV